MRRTARLNEKCRLLMAAGAWWSIADMASALACSECGASARIRDQRKAKYGAHRIIKRAAGNGFVYRMVSGESGAPMRNGDGFDFGDMSLDEICRRMRGTGADELPTPPGKPPVRIGDVLRGMQERGILPTAESK